MKATKNLERVRQRPVIRSQPVAREFEEENGKTTPGQAPGLAWGAPAISKEEPGPSLTEELKELPNFEERMSLNMVVILRRRQKQKWACRSELKVVQAALER